MADTITELTSELDPEDRTIRTQRLVEIVEQSTLRSLKEQIDLLTRSIDAMQAQRAELRAQRRAIIAALNYNIGE